VPSAVQPHRIEAFKRSTDPNFVDKMRDVVGLYMSPPERATVSRVDEKNLVQALDGPGTTSSINPGKSSPLAHAPRLLHDDQRKLVLE